MFDPPERQYRTEAALELYGVAHGETPVLGQAVLLTQTGNRLTLSEELLATLTERRRRGQEPLEVILVTEDAETALLLRLPDGLQVVGVVAERAWQGETLTGMTLLSGVADARQRLPEGYLLLLIPKRRCVLLEPSAEEIATLQRVREAPRVLLGATHTPALTQDGRTVAVWAMVTSLTEVETALDNGADGVLVIDLEGFAPFGAPPVPALLDIAAMFGGGAVGVIGALEVDEAIALAGYCYLHWCLPPETPLSEAHAALAVALAEAEAEDEPGALPVLVALGDEGDVSGWDAALFLPDMPLPSAWGLPPLWVAIDGAVLGDYPERLEGAVALGAVGVCVPPTAVTTVKDAIRAL